MVNQGQLTFNRADDVQFYQAISGEGAVNKRGAGSLTFNQSQSYRGDTTVSEGQLIVGDDSHPQTTLDSRRVNVESDATLGGYGQVNGSVNNRGTLAVADALSGFADRQTGSFTVGGDLNNAGRMLMASVNPDSRLIVKGNYVGNGGSLVLSTALAGDNSATDKLVISGNSSGSTSVVVNNSGGKGGQTVNGIQIVSVAGKSDGVFTLANRPVAGAYDYFLYQGTPTQADGNWYLRSTFHQQDVVVRPEGEFMRLMPRLQMRCLLFACPSGIREKRMAACGYGRWAAIREFAMIQGSFIHRLTAMWFKAVMSFLPFRLAIKGAFPVA